MRTHNVLRNKLGQWLADSVGATVAYEQAVARWTTASRTAVLDLQVTLPSGASLLIDITVAEANSRNEGVQRRRLGAEGAHILERAREKHRTYSGDGLVAFVLGSAGRFGDEAVSFLRQAARELPAEDRADSLKEIRRELNVALQAGKADCLLSSLPGQRPWQ